LKNPYDREEKVVILVFKKYTGVNKEKEVSGNVIEN
jgi:hypothetical protein